MSSKLTETEHTIRMWKIEETTPQEINRTIIPFEEDLEDWLENDISMISDDLLVIGRQIPTAFRGFIDLLCIDCEGNIVILELKRDKTPRDITAQILDYATWVNDLSSNDIFQIAGDYLESKSAEYSFEDVFNDKFQVDFPESLNEDHKMIVVGSNIDSSTQRIITYLSENGIAINSYTFNYFKDGGDSFIASTYLIEPKKAEASRIRKKKVTSVWTDSLEEIARRFKEHEPNAKIGKTQSTFRKIFTGFGSIHFEYLILGPRNNKSIYCSLHLEKPDREENIRILNELQADIEEFEKKYEKTLYYGSWYPDKEDHKWRTISASRFFGDSMEEEDFEWAANTMKKLYQHFMPALSKIL